MLVYKSMCSVVQIVLIFQTIAVHSVNSVVSLNSKFYGSWKDRHERLLCEKAKCKYISRGCASSPLSENDVECMALHQRMSNGTRLDNCPWTACESAAVNNQICQSGPCQYYNIPHGVCSTGHLCCSTSTPPSTTSLFTTNKPLDPGRLSTSPSSSLQTPLASALSSSTSSPPAAAPTTTTPPGFTTTTTISASTTTSPPKCLDPAFPDRTCIYGAFCSIDPAVNQYPTHTCPDKEMICCEFVTGAGVD